jgi:hypothetical protein
MKTSLFDLLNANNYHTFNRKLAHEIGLNATIMLSEIIDKFSYFEENGQLDDGWFYLTVETVFERTTLGKDAQASAIKTLIELGFIDMRRQGMPSKRYFKVFKEKITVGDKSSILLEASRQQDSDFPANKIATNPPTAPIYKNPIEDPYKIPPPPSSKQRDLDEPPTKEEEEEIQKRLRERPKDAPKIKSMELWRAKVLKEIRLANVRGAIERTIARKHRLEAEKYDMKKINGWTVHAGTYHVEFTQGSHLRSIFYDSSDSAWDSVVIWKKDEPKPN